MVVSSKSATLLAKRLSFTLLDLSKTSPTSQSVLSIHSTQYPKDKKGLKTYSSAASRSNLAIFALASLTAFFAANNARSASRSAASACRSDCLAAWMLGSPDERLNMPEVRFGDVVEVV